MLTVQSFITAWTAALKLLSDFNAWLEHWEPLWLFIVLNLELGFSVLIWRMARMEYWYDKEWNERKAARRKRQLQFDSLTQGEGR